MRAAGVFAILIVAFAVAGCGGGSGGAVPRVRGSGGGGGGSVGSAQPSDWTTFGDGLQRQGYNAVESTLSTGSVAGLRLQWSRNLGAAIDAQPLFAASVTIDGSQHDVLYVGTEAGVMEAIDAQSGSVLWQKALGAYANGCFDLENGQYGITGTPAYDRTTGRIYVADGQDKLHALDMTSGREIAGWPVTITANVTQEHVYGALTFNPANHLLYVETASYCDETPYQGRLVAVDTSSATIAATFLPAGTNEGGGLWGMGGASVDPASNDVFVATGNTESQTAHDAYGEQVVRLTSMLSVETANYPGLSDGSADYDFGATPMLYQSASCPAQLAVKNKDGVLYVYGLGSIAAGPSQGVQMAAATEGGRFIGVTAFLPSQGLVYVGDPGGYGAFTYGLVALKVQPDCTLALAWQATEGSSTTDGDNIGASVANGVVYSVDGLGDQVFANDAESGAPLWNSASAIGGPVFTPPTVANGRVYVGSWDHSLYAFAAP
jgi:outer membrane protein assembly factor BamB